MAVFNSRQWGSLTCNWGVSFLGWPIWWKAAGKIMCRMNLSDTGINSCYAPCSLVLTLVQPFPYSHMLRHSIILWLAGFAQAVSPPAGWPWPLHYLAQRVVCVCLLVFVQPSNWSYVAYVRTMLYLDTYYTNQIQHQNYWQVEWITWFYYNAVLYLEASSFNLYLNLEKSLRASTHFPLCQEHKWKKQNWWKTMITQTTDIITQRTNRMGM